MSTEQTIRAVVQEVLTQLQKRNGFTASKPRNGDFGVFANVDDAVAAANDGYQKLRNATLETRAKAIECVRQIWLHSSKARPRRGDQGGVQSNTL